MDENPNTERERLPDHMTIRYVNPSEELKMTYKIIAIVVKRGVINSAVYGVGTENDYEDARKKAIMDYWATASGE